MVSALAVCVFSPRVGTSQEKSAWGSCVGRCVASAWGRPFAAWPATVGRGQRRRAWDLPAGASRLVAEGKGVHGVWVNGERVVDRNGPIATASRAGKVLRDFAGK